MGAAHDTAVTARTEPAIPQQERRRRKKIIRPAREKKHALARLEYVLFLALFTFFRVLPFRVAFRLGEGLGSLLYWIDWPHRKVGLTNLALAFPAKDTAERQRILRESFRNLGRLLAEFCHLRSLTPENIHERVQFENETEWRQLGDKLRQTGALILTGHFGNWELFAHAAACYGLPMHIIHRRLRNVFIEKVLTTERERCGTTVIKKTTAGLEVFRAIKKKSAVVAAVDQNASGRMGVFVPFFLAAGLNLGRPGRPGSDNRGAGCAGFSGSGKRLGPTQDRNLTVDRTDSDWEPKEDIRATTAQFTAIFQDMVERYPDHWLWIHKRWKRRPDGDAPVYP